MRIAFLGASRYSYEILEFLLKNGFDICCILTIPQQAKELHTFADLKGLGKEYGVPVREIGGRIADRFEEIKGFAPELIFVFGWYDMIPRMIREIAPKGCVGIHASLLPAYAGGSPLVWAMINGEKETGITLFYMDGGVDTGDIISQGNVSIDYNDDIATLHAKVVSFSKEILLENLPKIEAGSAPRIKQDLSLRSVYPRRNPKDGKIDWSLKAEQVRDFIRAQTKPYPGAYCYKDSNKVTIWEAQISADQYRKGSPGEIVRIEEGLFIVSTGTDNMKVTRFEPSGLIKKIDRKDAAICLS